MWTKLARQVHRWKALHSLLELIARTLTVRFRSLLRVKRIMTFILFFKPKFYKNRGLHVVQEWKSGPRTLSEGGSQSDAMCNRPVGILFVWTCSPAYIYVINLLDLRRCGKTVCSNSMHTGNVWRSGIRYVYRIPPYFWSIQWGGRIAHRSFPLNGFVTLLI